MRRPIGVILTCIVLGFTAFSLLATAALFLFMTTFAGTGAFAQPGQPSPDPRILHAVFFVMGLILAVLAAWAIATTIGLARMKTWARYSVMIIGGGLALIGVLFAVGLTLSQAMVSAIAQQPGQDPTHVHSVMIIGGLFYLGIAAIGIWWLIYFAMRSTRYAFAQAHTPRLAPPIDYIPPPSPYAASSYQVASYIPTPDPAAPTIPPPAPVQVVTTPTPSHARPLAISILGWLLIAGGVFCLPFAFLQFPLLFLGTILTGWAAHLTALSFAVISGLTGLGLLRLEKVALYAACAFYILGMVNTSLFMLPSVRDRMVAYQTAMMQKMSMGMPMPPMFDNHMMGLMMLPGMFLGIAFCIVAIVFLVRDRAAFDRPQASA